MFSLNRHLSSIKRIKSVQKGIVVNTSVLQNGWTKLDLLKKTLEKLGIGKDRLVQDKNIAKIIKN